MARGEVEFEDGAGAGGAFDDFFAVDFDALAGDGGERDDLRLLGFGAGGLELSFGFPGRPEGDRYGFDGCEGALEAGADLQAAEAGPGMKAPVGSRSGPVMLLVQSPADSRSVQKS